MAEIVWTEEALSDLEAIGQYFDRTSSPYASVVVSKLYTSVERLTEHPKFGRQVPEVEHESLRGAHCRKLSRGLSASRSAHRDHHGVAQPPRFDEEVSSAGTIVTALTPSELTRPPGGQNAQPKTTSSRWSGRSDRANFGRFVTAAVRDAARFKGRTGVPLPGMSSSHPFPNAPLPNSPIPIFHLQMPFDSSPVDKAGWSM